MFVSRGGSRYDNLKLFKLIDQYPLTPVRKHLKKLTYVLDIPIWDNDITPRTVIKNPQKYKNHYNRIVNANLNYPIHINKDGTITDGYHRVIRALLLGDKTIKAYIVPQSIYRKAII